MYFAAGHPGLPEFLLPFRKPKRIRTAFSPSQLLKLEQAFENNQYVVGQERKDLAKTLHLSETQVIIDCVRTSSYLYSLCVLVSLNHLTIVPGAHICMVMAIIITRLLSNISRFMQIILDGSGSTMRVIMIALHLSPSQYHKPADDSFIPLGFHAAHWLVSPR